MERDIALRELSALAGESLHDLAKRYEVTIEREGRQNKGWAGHALERHLGLPLNSSQSPNFGSWELKCIPARIRGSNVVIKETMAITMIDHWQVQRTPFQESHLLSKLKKFLLVVREVGENFQSHSRILKVLPVDLSNDVLGIVEADYENVRQCIADPTRGFSALTGKMGVYVQPRTKGPGHGSTSRAFYARRNFLQDLYDRA